MISLHKRIAGLSSIRDLPGLSAQAKMAPPLRKQLQESHNKAYRESAVLIILFPDYKKNYQIVFIERSSYNGVHSAQIGFPGGKKEQTDSSLLQTAIRETHEELALRVNESQLLIALSPLKIPVSSFIVHPFVVQFDHEIVVTPDPREVAAVHIVDLEELLHSETKYAQMITGHTPYLDVNNQRLWGASAMIFSELRHFLAMS